MMTKKIALITASAIAALNLMAGVSAMADYRSTNGTSNDNGDGTYSNPVMNTDVADPDIICAPSPDGSEAYYMVSTAMQYSPGCPIMKSTDLINWETVTNLYDTLDYNSDALALRNGEQAYGNGQWATSLRYNESNKQFYILTFSYTTNTTQVYTSKDIENGPWKKSEFKCFHDPSIFIDTDNRIYVFYGQNSLNCKELIEEDGYLTIKPEESDPNNNGVNVIPDMTKFDVPDCIYKDAEPPTNFIIGGEGTHAYKVDGVYYLISITWPTGPVNNGSGEYWKRGEVCYRSVPDENGVHHVYGPYEGMLVMNQTADYDGYIGGGGVGQGGITNAIGGSNRSSEGNWYGMIFQDRGALGRCPHLVTVDWHTPGYEGWPMMHAAQKGEIPAEGKSSGIKTLVKSDDFDNGTKLNHAPVITKAPESGISTLALDEETFRVKYAYNDESDIPQSIEIASARVQPNGWVNIEGTLMTAKSIKYGHLEITADNPALNFYIDDVSVTDAAGKEYAHNGAMDGSEDDMPWWWGPTTVWDSGIEDNVPNAKAVTSAREYRSEATSMYIYDRENAGAGAMQYLNEGDDITGETMYNVSAWVKYSDSDVSEPTPAPTAEPPEGEELIENGGFESGEVAPWSARYQNGTKVEISGDVAASGKYSAKTSGRTNTSDGPRYDLNGKIGARREYVISAKVRYDEGPEQQTFNLTLEHVNDAGETGWSVLGSVTVKRGEWGELHAEPMIDPSIGTVRNNIYFETPYKAASDMTTDDTIDFYIDDVSVIRLPARAWEEVAPGENEPNGSNLDPAWQWNHNPDNRYWSLTEREGYLRLRNGRVVENIQQARNTLTQRTFGPECSGYAVMDTDNMKDGDYAGLSAFSARYGFIGVTRKDGKKSVVYVHTDGVPEDRAEMMKVVPTEEKIADIDGGEIYLKTEYTFDGTGAGDTVTFYYGTDGESWTRAGKMTGLPYSMLHFMGYKFALFNFATEEAGGYVDFDWFRVDDTLTAEGGAASMTADILGAADGKAKVKARIKNPSAKDLTVYAAARGADGKLIDVKSAKISGKSAEPEFELNVKDAEDYKVNVYLWDGLKPEMEVVTAG